MDTRLKKAANYTDILIQVLTDNIIELREQNVTIIGKLTNLEKFNATNVEYADFPEVLRTNQLCTMIGAKPQAIYDRVKKGTIPFMRTGKNIIYIKKEIIKWMHNSN